MKRILLFVSLLIWLASPALAQKTRLRVVVPEDITPYKHNRILVTCPEAGLLDITISSRALTWQVADQEPVTEGRNEITYFGLFTNDEPIHAGTFDMSVSLTRDGQTLYTTDLQVKAKGPGEYLQYVLPRNETLYLNGGVLEADYYMTSSRRLKVTLRAQGQSLEKARDIGFKRDKEQHMLFSWDGKLGKKKIAPGEYVLTFSVDDGVSPSYEMPFTAVKGAPPTYPLQVTPPGCFLPESMDDESVWKAITAPITVVKGRDIVRENILSAPQPKAPVAGQVSSATAGLHVLALEGNYAKVGAWRFEDGAYMEGYVAQDRLTTLLPNQRWGLVLDKAKQRITVYHDGKPIGSTRTSTGLMVPGRIKQESRAGAFTLGQRLPYFDNLGYRYKYAIRVDGRNLMHQLGHPTTGRMNFDVEDAVMGQKASHGCMRIDRLPGENGINAFWLWTHIPSTTKVLVLDDMAQRHARMIELGLTPGN
ncbi:MAG: L,D-transpeptidase [Christensenellales bacterium]|jgi:hypothetical protein